MELKRSLEKVSSFPGRPGAMVGACLGAECTGQKQECTAPRAVAQTGTPSQIAGEEQPQRSARASFRQCPILLQRQRGPPILSHRPDAALLRLAIRLLLLQEHFDGFAHRVNRFEIELGFDGDFLAGQILGHSP
jgi:hypothetical protein